jgi:hypothetical protein
MKEEDCVVGEQVWISDVLAREESVSLSPWFVAANLTGLLGIGGVIGYKYQSTLFGGVLTGQMFVNYFAIPIVLLSLVFCLIGIVSLYRQWKAEG